MSRLLHRQFLLWTTVIILTIGSAVSAAMMAPDRTDATKATLAMLGMTLDDICSDHAHAGQSHDEHEHRCPYCHLLSETPLPTPVTIALVLMPFSGWQQARDLHRRAQARDHARSPRAPPVFI
ncbi:hypothetical protein NBRC116586_15540 [Pseudooceanicola nitratireducens]|uniref:DUF2946 family protein n=1 Tax=Pseudooceanicola nitratireducens TaxID=517719 RepID=UPI0031068BD7